MCGISSRACSSHSDIFSKRRQRSVTRRKNVHSARYSVAYISSIVMKKGESVALPVAYVRLLVLLKPLPWKEQNANLAKKIYTAKRNMLRNMKSICFAAYSADYVKKLVQKTQYT